MRGYLARHRMKPLWADYHHTKSGGRDGFMIDEEERKTILRSIGMKVCLWGGLDWRAQVRGPHQEHPALRRPNPSPLPPPCPGASHQDLTLAPTLPPAQVRATKT